jgi:hypothetical protein
MNLDLLGLQIDSPLVNPQSGNFRPPSWPPPANWAPIVDAEGTPLCLYSDPIWPLDVWAGKPLKLNFGDGKTKAPCAHIDSDNANLLRMCVVWFMYGNQGCRTAQTLKNKFNLIRPLFAICSQVGIVATDLVRFEAVVDKVAPALPPATFSEALTILHDLFDMRIQLGFCLLDERGLTRLTRLQPDHETEQRAYIPPRIWTYQLHRLRECLQDYTEHKGKIEDCFQFCLDAYAHNAGSLKAALVGRGRDFARPFMNKKSTRSVTFHGSFKLTADRFGITEVLERWTGPFTGEPQISKFSSYLSLVSHAGLAYLLNFSLMRIEEGYNLRSDCLVIEKDEMFGDIPMLVGETTKTDPDADARWPVSKSASLAVDAMTHIAALRMRCARERGGLGITEEDEGNPYLMSNQYEPWGKGKHNYYGTRPAYIAYRAGLLRNPGFFDPEQITISEDDFQIALLLTPNLDREVFKVGAVWPFSWHQLRRTGAVNMQASGLVEDSSLQMQLKHMTRVQSLYYGRNHWHLALNNAARSFYLKTMYEEQARALGSIESPRFVSPLGETRKAAIVNLISAKDAAALIKAISRGEVSARSIRAGFCFNPRPCPYGGIESITHCLGGDGGKGCTELLVDVNKAGDISRYEKSVDDRLAVVHPDSPRCGSIKSEKRACGNYHAIVKVSRNQLS